MEASRRRSPSPGARQQQAPARRPQAGLGALRRVRWLHRCGSRRRARCHRRDGFPARHIPWRAERAGFSRDGRAGTRRREAADEPQDSSALPRLLRVGSFPRCLALPQHKLGSPWTGQIPPPRGPSGAAASLSGPAVAGDAGHGAGTAGSRVRWQLVITASPRRFFSRVTWS